MMERNKATLLNVVSETGGDQIWKATGGYPAQVAKAPVIDGHGSGAIADLTFGTAINVGDPGKRINSILGYGASNNLFVMKEDSFYEMVSDLPQRFQLMPWHPCETIATPGLLYGMTFI